VNDARRALDRQRGRKSPAELERLRIAAEITARGHLAAWRLLQPGVAEYELQAIAEGHWRREGGDGPAYGSIVGSGPNSTTLHYNRSDRIAQDGEVIVMDLATFFDGYAADVTRTVPVNGRFSPAQRDIYRIVLDAQKAAERQIRVDGPSRAMNDSSSAVLAAGLAAIGLIESAGATYDCGTDAQPRQCSQLSLYYMHGLGHGIGLNVHDPDQYAVTGRIGVGSAFTLEPGIYVRANLLEIIPDTPRNRTLKARIGPAVTKYANIGVRIEDDFLVTATGVVRASAAVPREPDEIERELAKPRLPLDTAAVSRYLRFKTGRY
jgi:Xaa-Pro aminopeptidase